MTSETPSYGRTGVDRFAVELGVLVLVVLSCLALQSYLRSAPGRRAFRLDETGIDLAAEARGRRPVSRGGLLIEASDGAARHVRLPPLVLEPDARYLVELHAGPGAMLSLAGHGPAGKRRLFYRFSSRPEARRYQRVFHSGDLPDRIGLTLTYRGARGLLIRSMTVHRLSSAHRALLELALPLAGLFTVVFCVRHRRRLRLALDRPRRADEVFFSLAVFGVSMFVFLSAGVQQMMDGKFLTVVSHSLLHRQTVELPDSFRPAAGAELPYQLQTIGERYYHFYSDAPALLNVPFLAAFELLGVTPVDSRRAFDRGEELRILRFAAAFLAAALCVVFYLIARRFLAPSWALGLVAAFAFGSQILSTLSRPFWSHTWAVLLSAVALYLALWPWARYRSAAIVLAATAVSWSFYCRPTMALTVLCLTALVGWRCSIRESTLFVGTGLAWAVAFGLHSQRLFGTVLPPYFLADRRGRGHFDVVGVEQLSYAWSLLGSVLSPGRGLLIYVPLVVVVLWLSVSYRRRLPSRQLAVAALVVIVAHWQLLAFTHVWPGSHSYGARHFSDILAWLFLLAVLAVSALVESLHTASRRRRWLLAVPISLVLAASVFVNVRGAFARDTWFRWPEPRSERWVERYSGPEPWWAWDWRYPQFMAGLIRPDSPVDSGVGDDDKSPNEP